MVNSLLPRTAWVLLLLLSIADSAAQQLPTRVVLDRTTFSDRSYPDLQQLANQVSATVDDLIPGQINELVYGSILIFQVTDGTLGEMPSSFRPPLTISADFKLSYEPASTSVGRTRIALFDVELPYAVSYRERFAYQLAHELAHVKMGVRINNFLVETLAVAVSHEVLVRLGMMAYANLEFNEQMHRLPSQIQLAYAKSQTADLKRYWQSRLSNAQGIDDRPAQTLGAALLRSAPMLWSALLNLALVTSCPLSSPPVDMRLCPQDLAKIKGIVSILASLGISPAK